MVHHSAEMKKQCWLQKWKINEVPEADQKLKKVTSENTT